MSAPRVIRYVLLVLVLAPCLLGILATPWFPAHLRTPEPAGMAFRVELPEAETPFETASVFPVHGGRSGVAIGFRNAVEVHAFPSGELVVARELAVPWRMAEDDQPSFDFDGDGRVDTIFIGRDGVDDGVVRVRSGVSGGLLLEDRDALEYETRERAFPLPDLDGDGCSELALFHPRMDRSEYDFEPWDSLLGARSWVTVISGRRACEAAAAGP